MSCMNVTLLLICWCVSHDPLFSTSHDQQIGRAESLNIPTTHKVMCDAEFLPFHDNTFDLVTSNLRSVKLCILQYIHYQ